MTDRLSQAIREAYASAPRDVVVIDTIELYHPTLAEPIRVVANHPNPDRWLAMGGAGAAAALAAVSPEARPYIGLIARLEASAPRDGGQMVAWVAAAFDLTLPEIDTGAAPELVLTIDNVSRDISDAMDLAVSTLQPVELIYRPYLSTDISAPQLDPPMQLDIVDVEADVQRVTARCRWPDLGGRAYPRLTYTPGRFPGLARG